jgi:hypothetical protein
MADAAMRLLTLQALSNLGSGGGGRGGHGGHESFEEYAFGIAGVGGSGAADDLDAGAGGGGSRGGAASVMKVQAAIRREPARWVEAYNGYLRRELGADELGAGWSAAEYGRRRVDWSGRPDLEHSFAMMAEVHRLLIQGKNVPQAEAFVCQSLKALEQAALDRRDWTLAWSFTGLAELRSTGRVRRGAAHPVEVSAGMSFLKELRTVEEWRAAGKKGPKGGGRSGAEAPKQG